MSSSCLQKPQDQPPKSTHSLPPTAESRIIGFVIAIVLHSSKKTALGAFHLRQVLGLFITGLVIWIPCLIISFIPFVNFLMILIWPAVGISLFVFWIMGLIAAINGQQKHMPVVGEYYQKWFAGAFV